MSAAANLVDFGVKGLSKLTGVPSYASGPLSALATGITKGSSGDKLQSDVANSLGKSAVSGLLSATRLPSYVTGPLGALATGIFRGDSAEDLQESVGNQFISSALGYAIPGAAPVMGVLNMLGFNPMQGLRDTFEGYQGAPGYQGELGGFFGKDAKGDGVSGSIFETYDSYDTEPGLRLGTAGLGQDNNEAAGLHMSGNGVSLAGLPAFGQFSGLRYGDSQAAAPVENRNSPYADASLNGAGYTPSPTNGGANLPGNYSGSGYGNTYGPGSGAGNAPGDSDY